MRKNLIVVVITMIYSFAAAQILPGTLDVTGMPSFGQTLADVVTEAGEDDKSVGFETAIDATQLAFILNPSSGTLTGVRTSEENCSQNVYRYKVFVHRTYNVNYEKTDIQVKTFTNSGARYPASIPYDSFISKPLGPRNLTPENGGQYISIPDNPSQALKIMEFVGCRTDIPLQFKILPSALSPAGLQNVEIFYTVVGSTF